jgi:subtilisin family serine protease
MNEKQFSICNIDQWHQAGFTGKGIKIATSDISSLIPSLPYFKGQVIDAFKDWNPVEGSHVDHVVQVLLQVAPDAEIHCMGSNPFENMKYCIEHSIHVFNQSTTGGTTVDEYMKLENEAISKGLFPVCSAGNDGYQGLTSSARKDTFLSVGAVHYGIYAYGIGIYRPDYSSYGEKELDVVGFSGLDVINRWNGTIGITGTSFSSPFVAGMIALYYQWFIQTYRRNPTWKETYTFATTNVMDLEAQGFDIGVGYGLFVLPEINTLPKKEGFKLELYIDKKTAYKNGEQVELVIAPFIKDSRAFIGLRDIAVLFGCKVDYDPKTKKVTITK